MCVKRGSVSFFSHERTLGSEVVPPSLGLNAYTKLSRKLLLGTHGACLS